MKFIKEPPDDKTRNHIKCPMGKIGEATNSVDQGKANGHQGKRKTIDNTVDENIHDKTDIGELEWWSIGVMPNKRKLDLNV
jgi:hypothetical protein